MNTKKYQWYQCIEADCLFRCPALPHELPQNQCPNCKGEMRVENEEAFSFNSVDVPKPEAGAMGLLLDNIRSIYNVGALFRTTNGASIPFLFCCGMSATPEHPKVAKTALGAESWQSWQYQTNGLQTAVFLQKAGWKIWAIEKVEQAQNLFTLDQIGDENIVLVCGNENAGVDPAILNLADKIVSLPMLGQKESLNVAVATGIVVYTLKFGLKS